MKIIANEIRTGNVLEYKNKLWTVLRLAHTQPGKGGAFIQAEMKSLGEGTKLNERFRSTEWVEKAHLDGVDYQYLFSDDSGVTVIDLNYYEQITLSTDIFGEQLPFLQDGMTIKVVMHDNTPISVELPEDVTLEIVEAEAVIKGQTASSSYKPATLENGVRVMVPQFVGAGDRIVVKTADGSYVERAKG
jgi:elongation factor P